MDVASGRGVGYKYVMPDNKFRSVLITGASSGIGRAVALHLASPGVYLSVTGRDSIRLEETAQALRDKGADVVAEQIDVSDRTGMTALIAAADRRAPLDLVIANAGISSGSGAGAGDDEVIRDIFVVNLAGVLNTVLPAAALMRARRRGRLAIVSSVAGFRGLPTAPAYSASKVAVRAWGEAIRPRLAEDGVALTMIFPGFVESRITAANDFPMPLLMPAEKAADIIVRGLARGKRSIAFPWPTIWAMRLLSLLPGPVFDAVLARGPKKP